MSELLPNCDLRLLAETYKFQNKSSLSIHQKHLLLALEELQARRANEWICPGCHLRQDGPKIEPSF